MSVTTSGLPQERTGDHGARVLRVPPPVYYGAVFAGIMLCAVSVAAGDRRRAANSGALRQRPRRGEMHWH